MQTQLYETLIDKHREEILAAEDYIWRHPETGFREWKTTAYMQDVFEKAGYTLVKAGDIPGFYTDIETGRPGPKLLIMAELDALSAPNHVQAVDGCAHACGHGRDRAGAEGAGRARRPERVGPADVRPGGGADRAGFPRRPAPRGRDPLSRRQDRVHAPRIHGRRGSGVSIPHQHAHRLRF